jgi:hypothetical protein
MRWMSLCLDLRIDSSSPSWSERAGGNRTPFLRDSISVRHDHPLMVGLVSLVDVIEIPVLHHLELDSAAI